VEKLGSEFAGLLEELTNKKTCKEHGQNVVIICTDFQCSRRFWCGICCVKYKELFTKYMGSMCSINDFLKDNISKLYKIKTFNETQKKDLESKINQIMSRNVESFEHIWDQIDKDVDLLKKEIYDRLDNAKMSLKERYLRSMKMMKSFYNELKTKVNESEPRDVAGELDAMLERVKKEEVDPLDVIENIGNKVAVDIIEIEALNYEFEKSRSFVDFIFNGYETVRVATIPTYVSIQKDIEELVDKVEILSIPKIKATLQEPAKEIDSLLIYYESLIANDLGKELVERTMTEYLLQHDRDARSMQDDSYEAAMKEDKKLRSKKKKQSEPKVPPHVLYPNKTIHGPVSPVKDSSLRNSLNSSVQSQFSNPPSFYQKNSFLSNLNPSDADLDSSERNLLVPKTHDGALLSIPQDCDLDGLEKKATIAVTQDGKDFTPVIYILNNKFMISSFQKKESANSVAYGYRIYSISEDQKGECKSSLVYSSEALLLGKFKISHISCLERDSDDTNLLCLSTEEGFIYIFKFVIGEGDNFIFEIENTVVPKNSTNSVTCMRKLARTDYIIYTNTKGDIMTYDTIKGEVIASENSTSTANSSLPRRHFQFLFRAGEQIFSDRVGQPRRSTQRQLADLLHP
jgi:hypothetical protein